MGNSTRPLMTCSPTTDQTDFYTTYKLIVCALKTIIICNTNAHHMQQTLKENLYFFIVLSFLLCFDCLLFVCVLDTIRTTYLFALFLSKPKNQLVWITFGLLLILPPIIT